eukprot:TRINITY_DN21590_c0_g1_i1.p1 TRINITY_DN21590_c0_g1~~TRINITY_DN21590_c0_g1_i1.p1  ORF type:complete len:261 (+),score=86.58 TRINITY_DN21590_c0_g1_i1:72-785(+)
MAEAAGAADGGLSLVQGLLGQRGNVGARRALGVKRALEAADAAAKAPREALFARLRPKEARKEGGQAFPPPPTERSAAFAELCVRRTLSFDAAALPILEAARRYFGAAEPALLQRGLPLSQLHRACDPDFTVGKTFAAHKARLLDSNPASMDELHRLYRALIEKVIAPHVAEAVAGHGEGPMTEIRFQREPVLRVCPPSHAPMGVPHCDAEYGHQQAQVNFWLPLCEEVGGENSRCG